MRIAFVSTVLHYPWGGADVLWTRAAEALAPKHDLLLAVSAAAAVHPRLVALRAAGARVHLRSEFTAHRGRRSRWKQNVTRLLRLPQSLLGALDSFRPDFIFVNQGGTFDFLIEDGLVEWLLGHRTPFTLICQANDDQMTCTAQESALAGRFLPHAQNLFFVSSQNRDLARRQTGLSLANAALVDNPIEIRPAAPLPWPRSDIPRLALLTRLEIQCKGLDLLVEAAAACASRSNFIIDIFGHGPDAEKIKDSVRRAGLEQRILFQGRTDDVLQVWTHHHALLLPSRYEGSSLAMLEAMACGRIVIAADVGGVRDWVIPGENGSIFSRGDARDFAATLSAALAAFSQWSGMGLKAFQTIQRMHHPHPEQTVIGTLTSASLGGKHPPVNS